MSTYSQVGKIQELSNLVKQISSEDTPFQTVIGKESSNSETFTWVEESLATAGSNAVIEGAAFSSARAQNLESHTNYTQLMDKTVSLTSSEQAALQAGAVHKMAYNIKQATRELLRDKEFAYVGTAQSATPGAAGTSARKTAGYQAQIHTSMVRDMVAAPVTEAVLNGQLEALFSAGAQPTHIMTSGAGKVHVSGVLNATRQRDIASTDKAAYGISVYMSDFGQVEIVPNRFVKYDGVNKGDILIFNPEMWTEKVLQEQGVREGVAKEHADTKNVFVEAGLLHRNWKASALITNVKFK